MKISVRPLKADSFDLEVDPGDTVESMKAKITAAKPDLPSDGIKTVFAGRVLQDGATLAECGVKEGDFVVVMTSKPKAAATPAAAAPAPAAASPAAVPAATPAMPSAPAPAPAPAAQPMVNPETVQMLCDMGFIRSDVERCLRAAFGNADRAVEYLMTGIPQGVSQQMQAAAKAPPAAPPAAAAGMGGAPQNPTAPFNPMMNMFGQQSPPGPANTGPLAALANHPIFPRLRQAVQQEPQSLNRVLAALSQTDPNMLQLVAEHQEEFVELLQAPAPAAAGAPALGRAASTPAGAPGQPADPVAAMMAAAGMGMPGSGAPAAPAGGAAEPAAQAPPAAAAPLTAEDEAAITHLMSFGFDRTAALQAYLACGKNVENAASFLFDAGDDDDE